MRVSSAIFVVLVLAAQHHFVRAQAEEAKGEFVAGGTAEAEADADAEGGAGARRLLYTAPQVVTTTAPSGVACVWGAWSAWSTCYQNAYSKDEPLRRGLLVFFSFSSSSNNKTSNLKLQGSFLCNETLWN